MIATKKSVVAVASILTGEILRKVCLFEKLGPIFTVAQHSKNDNLLLLSKNCRFAELEYIETAY